MLHRHRVRPGRGTRLQEISTVMIVWAWSTTLPTSSLMMRAAGGECNEVPADACVGDNVAGVARSTRHAQ